MPSAGIAFSEYLKAEYFEGKQEEPFSPTGLAPGLYYIILYYIISTILCYINLLYYIIL